ETYHKRFDFYSIDKEAKFYVLLKSDTTELHRIQDERNAKLKEALDEAQAASVAKTAFLSRMSHEIRTPMNAIIGLDNIALKEQGISPEMRGNLSKIGQSAKYLLSLINDILDMSRIESGRMSLKNEEFSFMALIAQINTVIEEQCRDRGLSYEYRLNGRFNEVYIGDDIKLKQVLINILGNSVKFTEPGGKVSFIVESHGCLSNQCTLRFIIKDTGVGIDREFLPRIFEAFSQEDGTNTSVYGGSGLGMAITKNIVSLMNGNISVESEKGKGSCFTVDVALKVPDEDVVRKELDIDPHEMKILIIDDDPIALKHAKIELDELGISAETAESGAEGIEMVRLCHARREPYNFIVLDLRMPELDGIEVCKRIRQIAGDESSIVMATAYNWADVEEMAADAGIDSFVSKPLFASGVLYEFKQIIKKKHRDSGDDAPIDLNGRKILLAEDVEINAEIMEQLLEMKGMETEHAENGELCLKMFEESPIDYYDAILMDVRMPVMDGLSATAAIRALDRPDARTVPIIAMTANAFDEDVQRSLNAGMNAHLSKPVEPDNLYDALSGFIKERAKIFY
nr:response regulator [Lachnospiraceae bacterium]